MLIAFLNTYKTIVFSLTEYIAGHNRCTNDLWRKLVKTYYGPKVGRPVPPPNVISHFGSHGAGCKRKKVVHIWAPTKQKWQGRAIGWDSGPALYNISPPPFLREKVVIENCFPGKSCRSTSEYYILCRSTMIFSQLQLHFLVVILRSHGLIT